MDMNLTHLQRLEAESLHIFREVVAEADKPVMLYSIGKDSAVMLHLARKAFFPAPPPFPLLHVDTTWKFRAMYALRERMARESGMELLVYQNPEAKALGINPFDHGSQVHTDLWKTQGLKQALDQYGFDVAFGGGRRDEEKSRAKERIFSFRSTQHRWDPKNQRPELWRLYNTRKKPGESIRVFPISNWTELDIWQYIYLENIPIVPLYFAAERPVVNRGGTLIMVDDERLPLLPGEVPMRKHVRFRTLYYIGANTRSARLYGVRVERVKLAVFVVSGLLAGLAGIMEDARRRLDALPPEARASDKGLFYEAVIRFGAQTDTDDGTGGQNRRIVSSVCSRTCSSSSTVAARPMPLLTTHSDALPRDIHTSMGASQALPRCIALWRQAHMDRAPPPASRITWLARS